VLFQGDIYARYQCYGDAEDFAAAIRKSAPIKIDIGAVFNARPSEHKSLPAPIVPVERKTEQLMLLAQCR
jgi:DNA primase small subunit